MHSASKLLLSASLATLLLASASSCSGEATQTAATGPQLFQVNCAMCHGADGSGSNLAPTIHGKKGFWTRETLVKYMIDPAGYASKDARLKSQAGKYSLPMTSMKMLPKHDLETLADHVLAMP
jgi:mono/diheme cytochrome c family protein